MLTLQWIENTFILTALWMLEEAGAPYQLTESAVKVAPVQDILAPANDFAIFYAPTLQDANVELTNLAAICVYLAERYPDTALAPSIDDPQRRKYFHWLFSCYACFAPCKTGGEKTPDGNRKHMPFFLFQRASYHRILASLKCMSAADDWIIGDHFSSADVMLGSILVLGREQFGLPSEAVNAPAYLQKCLRRPALRRAMAIVKGI